MDGIVYLTECQGIHVHVVSALHYSFPMCVKHLWPSVEIPSKPK